MSKSFRALQTGSFRVHTVDSEVWTELRQATPFHFRIVLSSEDQQCQFLFARLQTNTGRPLTSSRAGPASVLCWVVFESWSRAKSGGYKHTSRTRRNGSTPAAARGCGCLFI